MRDASEVRDFLSAVQDRRKQRLNENRQITVEREAQSINETHVQPVPEVKKDIRADEFLRRIKKPRIVIPDPAKDFHMYERMSEAMDGLHEHLDRLRRNYGAVGYAAQNLMSDLSKAYIREVRCYKEGSFEEDGSSEEELAFLEDGMEQLSLGLNEAAVEIAETGNRFSRTVWQEGFEANLFRIWFVIVGRTDEVPKIISWRNFGGNVQAYLYGYLDIVSELIKGVGEEITDIQESIFKKDISLDDGIKRELFVFQRCLAITLSIVLRLSHERHIPGYIINNGYGPWMAYTRKLRTAEGSIAHLRREYNTVLREFNLRSR